MSPAVVVVGPTAVRGPRPVAADLASLALEGIDEDLALLDERVVSVDQLWRDVLAAALGDAVDGVVLVCPSWWTGARIARVEAAARMCSAEATVSRRADVLAVATTVVEVAPDLVVVRAGAERHVVARVGESVDVIAAIGACLDGLDAVTVDIPSGLAVFGAEVTGALRRAGIDVTVADDRAVVRAARVDNVDVSTAKRRSWRRMLTPRVAAATVTVAALVGAGVGLGTGESPAAFEGEAGTWLVEGRVAVEIPAQWSVERVTSGPGSDRVQVVSPSEAFAAIHVTQARVPDDQTLDATAATLRLALADEPDGVFVDFTALSRRAERSVVSYREIRADHHVSWSVLLDRGVRIAIGCQGPVDARGPERLCDRAIRSAHAVA